MRGQFCAFWMLMCQMLAAFSTFAFRMLPRGALCGCQRRHCPNVLNAASIWHIGCMLRLRAASPCLKRASLYQVPEPVKRCEHLTGSRFLGAESTAPGFRRPSARPRLGALLGEAGTRGPFPETRASAQFRCRASSGKALRTRRFRWLRGLCA